MKEYFQQQLEYVNPITEDLLQEIPQKNYTSGEEKQVGDQQLFAFRADFEIKDDIEELSLTLFSLCEREFPYYSDQYTTIKNPLNSGYELPILVKKGEEDKYELMKNEYLKGI